MASPSTAVRLKRLRQRFGISAPKVSVRTHVAWYWRALLIIVVLSFSLAAAAWIYDAGRAIAGFDSQSSAEKMGALREKVATLEAEVAQLRGVTSAADSNLKVEKAAQQQLAQQVKALEAENAGLKQDLAFFEGLVPEGGVGEPGVRINRLRFDPEGSGGQYRYRMLLVFNGNKQVREFRGTLQFVLKVQQGGKDVMITAPSESDPNPQRYRVEIRNFQRVEGVLSVPAGAVLKSVEARLLQDGAVRARQTLNL